MGHTAEQAIFEFANVGLLLCQKQTVFWKQVQELFSIRGFAVEPGSKSIFLSLPQKIESGSILCVKNAREKQI